MSGTPAFFTWLRRLPGMLMALAVGGYTLYVLFAFGIGNPDRPKNQIELAKTVIEYMGVHDRPDDIYKRIVIREFDKQWDRELVAALESIRVIGERTAEHHYNVSYRRELLQKGQRYDLDEFMRNEYERKLANIGVRFEIARVRSVLYVPNEEYTVVCRSSEPVDATIRAIIEQLSRYEWAIPDGKYDRKGRVARFLALRGGLQIEISVWSDAPFFNGSANILWELKKANLKELIGQ